MNGYRHFLLTVAYDGTGYSGFQYQENAISIQAVLERHLAKLFSEPIRVRGASRTDAGVHALGQRVQFRTRNFGIPFEKIKWALNRSLPANILVREILPIDESFHLHSTLSKTYIYQILNQEEADPFQASFFWHIRNPLDFSAMERAAKYFIGEHDFAAFRASGYQTKTSVRQMFKSEWLKEGNQLTFLINGNGFLYHMVRNMVGTLVEVGMGKYDESRIPEIIASGDRKFAGVTAPARGLFLKEIFYSEKSFTLQNNSDSL